MDLPLACCLLMSLTLSQMGENTASVLSSLEGPLCSDPGPSGRQAGYLWPQKATFPLLCSFQWLFSLGFCNQLLGGSESRSKEGIIS